MRKLNPITEDEMVAVFLKTEIDSVRFEDKIGKLLDDMGVDRAVVDRPDILSPAENEIRARLLDDFRGYRRREGLFMYFPDDAAWYRCLLAPEDLANVQYINYSYWNELSAGTRSPLGAVEPIRNGVVIYGQSTECYLKLAEALRGGAVFPEPILLGRDENSTLTILEGHVRFTMYALAPECIGNGLPVIVGFSPTLSDSI